ncbi:cation:proton antiporter [Ideonella livida]|uniref:Sodium:proton antiporter n=1 Tax=Ideonella livida TaxID=2707176 RepID=A0A7C9TL03_9BURK|nr:cation:proton antiporter [Ideonella livida]NDY92878.1 sodium:proton antiporter [Ideonella livida]
MPHAISLITTLAAAFGLALILGFAAVRLRLPALLGYLLAGVVIGPFTPGFVADTALAGQLAEIGVMLLMFGVGLHFSLDDLLAVRKVAVPGAVVQMGVATALGAGLALAWGWSPAGAVVFGLTLSVASTVVMLKALESQGLLASGHGRIAVGWLVVEDLAMVLVLVLLPPLAGLVGGGPAPAGASGQPLWATLGRTLLAVAAFVGLMLLAGRRALPWLLWQVARTGSRELFTLAVVAAAVGIAVGSALLFGVSFALGAFFAGMVLRESPFSHRAAEESLPLRDAFAVLFFVSVGMLFDPRVLLQQPLQVLGVVAVVVVGKFVAAAGLVLLLRYPLNTALIVAASLAQVGEFSFILVGLGIHLGVLPQAAQNLVLAGALVSIALNPLAFAAAAPLGRWIRERSALARQLEARHDPLAALPADTAPTALRGHVVVVGGDGPALPLIEGLRQAGQPCVVVDARREVVELWRGQGQPAVLGECAEAATLVQAHVAHARLLVMPRPQAPDVPGLVATARTLQPRIGLLLAAQDEQEALRLAHEVAAQGEHPAGVVLEASALLAQALLRQALAASAAPHVSPQG